MADREIDQGGLPPDRPAGVGRRLPGTALAAAAVFVRLAVLVTVAWELLGDAVTDIALYRTYGERVAGGLVPYRDFSFEYPPGALPALVLPALVTSSLEAYRVAFVAELAIVGALAVLAFDLALRRSGPPAGDRRVVLDARPAHRETSAAGEGACRKHRPSCRAAVEGRFEIGACCHADPPPRRAWERDASYPHGRCRNRHS